MRYILLLIVCWFVGHTTAKELSKTILDFLAYTTGEVDNKFQTDLDGEEYDVVRARIRRVHVPSLEPNVTIFIEVTTSATIMWNQLTPNITGMWNQLTPNITGMWNESTPNTVNKFFQLGVVSEGPSNTLSLKLYSFTDHWDVKLGSYDLAKLSQVKLENLQSDEECVATFKIWSKGLMTGVYPVCQLVNNGKHPYLIVTYTCDFDTVVYPPITGLGQPYVLHHKSATEPQPDAPKDYVSPCDK